MKTRRTLRSVLSLLCCLAMLMAWLSVLPAAADSTNVIFSEDFEEYSDTQALETGAKFILKNVPNGGTVEGDAWINAKPASGTADGKITCSASNVTLNSVKVTTRISSTMPERIHGIAGGPEEDLAPLVQPTQSSMAWTTSDPVVATVKDGVVPYVGKGIATITLNADGAVAACTVTVDLLPAELSGEGEKKIVFFDDYEKYSIGTNAF